MNVQSSNAGRVLAPYADQSLFDIKLGSSGSACKAPRWGLEGFRSEKTVEARAGST